MCFWCAAIFFPPATSSKDVTTRLHTVPPISPPPLLSSFLSPSSLPYLPLLSSPLFSIALPSAEETPTGESEGLQRCESTAVTSPFSAVSHHTVSSPPSNCHCTSRCNSARGEGVRTAVARGNKNENDMDIMNGRRRGKKKKQGAYAEESRERGDTMTQ